MRSRTPLQKRRAEEIEVADGAGRPAEDNEYRRVVENRQRHGRCKREAKNNTRGVAPGSAGMHRGRALRHSLPGLLAASLRGRAARRTSKL